MAVRESGIDAGRFIGFVGVTMIHTVIMGGEVAVLGEQWGRFAVPMFFMVSGYFLNLDEPVGASVRRHSKRLLPIFAFWATLYLVAFSAWPSSPREWAMLLIKGGKGNHLWFIQSLWLCVVAAAVLVRLLGLRSAILVAVGLYAAGLAIGAYAPLLGIRQAIWNPRDGLTFGLLPLLLGCLLRRHPITLETRWAVFWFFALSAVHIGEYRWALHGHPRYPEFFVSTPLLAGSAFVMFRSWHPTSPLALRLADLGRYSLGFYAIHMFFVQLGFRLLPGGTPGWLIATPGVVILAVAVTMVLAKVPAMRRFIQ